jgi:hypothetical protein
MTEAHWEGARRAIVDGLLVPDVIQARVVGSSRTPSYSPETLWPRANG